MTLILVIHCQTFTMFYGGKTHKTGVHKTPLPICKYRLCSYHHLRCDYESRPENPESLSLFSMQNNDIPVFPEYNERTQREFGFELIRGLIYALLSMFKPVNRCAAHSIGSRSRRGDSAENSGSLNQTNCVFVLALTALPRSVTQPDLLPGSGPITALWDKDLYDCVSASYSASSRVSSIMQKTQTKKINGQLIAAGKEMTVNCIDLTGIYC